MVERVDVTLSLSLLLPTSAGRGRVWRDGGRRRSERGKDRGGRADIYLWFPFLPRRVLYLNFFLRRTLLSITFHLVSHSHYFSLSLSH